MNTQQLLSLLLALLGLYLFTSCSAPKKDKELTVLSWNIWHAGHSKEYPGVGCEGTIGILKKSEADVIIMVETYGGAPRIADSLGYNYHLISDNLCIFSRYPITQKYDFSDAIASFNFGGVEIDVDGTPVRLFDTWLHYLPDMRTTPTDSTEAAILAWDNAGTRDDEVRTILHTLQPFLAEADSVPVIMAGDFNSFSHLDWTEATKNLYHHGGAVVNWTVSKEMEAAKFKDSFRELNPDPVTHPGTTWLTDADSLATPHRSDRIDFIYYQGNGIQATASESHNNFLGQPYTFRGEEFLYASDHGFVLTTFRIASK